MLAILFFLCLLAQVGCAPYLVVSRGEINKTKLQEIQRGVVTLRGLDFKAEVPVEVKNRDEMKRYFEMELDKEYGDEKLQNKADAYAKLGLLPKKMDLKKALLDFYTAQVAAFYDPRAKRLVLPEDLSGGILLGALQLLAQRDIVGEMVLAHEFTHALQDQHFSIGQELGPSNNDDRTLAFRAVVEGDATLSGFAFLLGGIDENSLAQVNQSVQESLSEARSTLSDIPQAIIEELLFQYYGGVSFVSRLIDKGGWVKVNSLYRSPPLSTEQVLHPEKYLDLPDPPTRIDLQDISSLFTSEWKEIENNVLGELMVQVLFKRFLSDEEARRIADGWDGDRFVAFRRGDEISFIWATVWDSPQDAEEFLEKYREVLSKKYGGPESAGSAYSERRGQRVVVVEGLKGAQMEGPVEKIWQGLKLEEEPFRPPFPSLCTGCQ